MSGPPENPTRTISAPETIAPIFGTNAKRPVRIASKAAMGTGAPITSGATQASMM